jgi:hypothetical protein
VGSVTGAVGSAELDIVGGRASLSQDLATTGEQGIGRHAPPGGHDPIIALDGRSVSTIEPWGGKPGDRGRPTRPSGGVPQFANSIHGFEPARHAGPRERSTRRSRSAVGRAVDTVDLSRGSSAVQRSACLGRGRVGEPLLHLTKVLQARADRSGPRSRPARRAVVAGSGVRGARLDRRHAVAAGHHSSIRASGARTWVMLVRMVEQLSSVQTR